VLLTDIRMPPLHSDEGIRAAREVQIRHPGTGVVVLSQYAKLGLTEEEDYHRRVRAVLMFLAGRA
jgi:DNA-binding NarL/FixJ family response regulator